MKVSRTVVLILSLIVERRHTYMVSYLNVVTIFKSSTENNQTNTSVFKPLAKICTVNCLLAVCYNCAFSPFGFFLFFWGGGRVVSHFFHYDSW